MASGSKGVGRNGEAFKSLSLNFPRISEGEGAGGGGRSRGKHGLHELVGGDVLARPPRALQSNSLTRGQAVSGRWTERGTSRRTDGERDGGKVE